MFPRRRKRHVRHHDIVPHSLVAARTAPLRRLLIPVGALLCIVAVSLLVMRPGRAQSLTLYPSTCLGGWTNPMRAAGEPETGTSPLPGRFSSENSAVLPENTAAEIFCGGFTAEIPPDTRPRSLVVALSLSTGAAPEVIETDTFASSTGEVLDAPPGSSVRVDEPVPEPVPEPLPEEPEPPPEPAPAPEPEPEPPPEPADQGPVSHFLVPVAYAQETLPEPEPEPAPPGALPSDGTFLEVRYTFDGTDWHTIDTLDAGHTASQSFAVPLPEGATWSDLSALQISVRAHPTLDHAPLLYLDGMRLSIAYESLAPDPLFDPLTGGRQIILNASAGFITATDVPATTTPPTLFFIDTLILSDAAETETGLAIYDEARGTLLVDTIVGNRKEYAHAASGFGEGTFVVLQTLVPGECTRLPLADCRARAKGEWSFSVVEKPGDVAPSVPAPATTTEAAPSPAIPPEPGASIEP